MIISDMTYQINAVESNEVEGGFDIGGSITGYYYDVTQLYTATQSGPNGSSAIQSALKINLDTFGAAFVALGL